MVAWLSALALPHGLREPPAQSPQRTARSTTSSPGRSERSGGHGPGAQQRPELLEYYNGKGEAAKVEIMAYGRGSTMLRDDTSPVKERLKHLSEGRQLPGKIQFSACHNTNDGHGEEGRPSDPDDVAGQDRAVGRGAADGVPGTGLELSPSMSDRRRVTMRRNAAQVGVAVAAVLRPRRPGAGRRGRRHLQVAGAERRLRSRRRGGAGAQCRKDGLQVAVGVVIDRFGQPLVVCAPLCRARWDADTPPARPGRRSISDASRCELPRSVPRRATGRRSRAMLPTWCRARRGLVVQSGGVDYRRCRRCRRPRRRQGEACAESRPRGGAGRARASERPELLPPPV